MLAHDALVCGSCGNLRSVCSDESGEWHPHKGVCYVSASVEWGKRRLQSRYEKVPADGDSLHPLDGAFVYPSLFAPVGDDEFLPVGTDSDE